MADLHLPPLFRRQTIVLSRPKGRSSCVTFHQMTSTASLLVYCFNLHCPTLIVHVYCRGSSPYERAYHPLDVTALSNLLCCTRGFAFFFQLRLSLVSNLTIVSMLIELGRSCALFLLEPVCSRTRAVLCFHRPLWRRIYAA